MKKKIFIILTFALIGIEQLIKLIINHQHLMANKVIIKNFLYFKPMFNRDYSWINSLFNLGVSKFMHIFLVGLIVVMVILVYAYIRHKELDSKLVAIAFSFLLAGGTCSLIDKIFWNGSLDYIYVQNQFTFDLKDVYINVFVGLMVLMFIFDHQGFRSKDSDHVLKDFTNFLRRR